MENLILPRTGHDLLMRLHNHRNTALAQAHYLARAGRAKEAQALRVKAARLDYQARRLAETVADLELDEQEAA